MPRRRLVDARPAEPIRGQKIYRVFQNCLREPQIRDATRVIETATLRGTGFGREIDNGEAHVTTRIALRTKIRVNGKEYTSVDDMPADVRAAHERALATMRGATPAALLGKAATVSYTTIAFEGKEYHSLDEMPVEVHQRYQEVVVAALESGSSALPSAATVPGQQPQRGDGAPRPESLMAAGALRAESTGSRLLVAAVVIAALLLASFVFGR